MNATIDTKRLRDGLSRLSAIPGVRGASPSINAVRISADEFNGLTLTRITPEARAKITYGCGVKTEGKTTVDIGHLIALCAKTTEKELSLELNGVALHLRAGKSDAELSKWDEEGLLKDHPPILGQDIKINAAELCDKIGRAVAAAYRGQGRDELSGICFRKMNDRLSIFGADGRRVHVCWFDNNEQINANWENDKDDGVSISIPAAEAVRKVFSGSQDECQITFGDGVEFATDEISLRVPRSVKVPAYIDRFLTHTPATAFEIDREQFAKTISASMAVTNEYRHVTFSTGVGVLKIHTEVAGAKFKEEIPAQIIKGGGSFTADGQFLLDLLDCAQNKTTHIAINDSRALVIEEADFYGILSLCLEPKK